MVKLSELEIVASRAGDRLSRNARLLWVVMRMVGGQIAEQSVAARLLPNDADAPGLIADLLAELNRERLVAVFDTPAGRFVQALEPENRAARRERPAQTALALVDDGFESFWRVYPRKVDKATARKAYDRAIKARKATASEIEAGAVQYAVEKRGSEPQYIKHPATWINGECWRNEPEPLACGGPRAPSGAAAGILSFFEEREAR